MKRLSACIICLVSAVCHAGTAGLNPGTSMTTGLSPSHHSIFAAHHNPASASFAIKDSEHWRIGYGPTLGVGVELGDASNFIDEIDDLIDILDDPSLSEDGVQETLDRFNRVLIEVGKDGYLQVNNGLSMPVYWRPSAFGGTLFLEMGLNSQINSRILDSELTYDDQNESYATATSAYIKSGVEKRLALGYSKELFNRNKFEKYGGRLYGGIKLNLLSIELSKQVVRLQNLDGKDIEDVIEDEYENNLETTTNIGVDAGLLWVAERYQIGATITNINAPSFDYGAIGTDCETQPDASIQRNNCEAAFSFANEITLVEQHKKHPVISVDATYFFNPDWFITSSAELAVYEDMVGSEHQWFHVASAYNPNSRWLPATRIGYHKNLAGSNLSSLSLGLTFFGVLTLDAEMAMDSVTVDGTSVPRRVGFSIGFQEQF